jgi:hypothetical protein
LEEEEFLPELNFPILIRLRDLRGTNHLLAGGDAVDADVVLAALENILDVSIEYPTLPSEANFKTKDAYKDALRKALADRGSLRRRAIVEAIDCLAPLIILDGFDEIASIELREHLIKSIRHLAVELEVARMVLTSRTGEFIYHIEKMAQFEIHPLTDPQIRVFAQSWLGNDSGKDLVAKIRASPFGDTAIRPLTIAHLCAIYERIGSIPEKPKTVYRKIVSLLLEKWDEQRSVKRISSYAKFEVDRKLEFLSHLAFTLTVSLRSSVFSRADLSTAYHSICANFSLPQDEAARVARELESHTGLFIESGAELYEFSHKSIQEYLAAEFIVKLPSIPPDKATLLLIPNELAISTAISSRPSEYFVQLFLERLPPRDVPLPFLRTYVSRLMLERPDFDCHDVFCGVLLTLYSRYVKATYENTRMGEHRNELAGSFEDLEQVIRASVSGSDLLKAFRLQGTADVSGGGQICCLERTIQAGHVVPQSIRDKLRGAPSIMWVRSSLL